MKVSIIVPIYNGSKYIDNLYQAIKKQTLNDYELIFVNDGSCDDSLIHLDEIELNDEKVVVLRQENYGLCSARNLGLKYANGEFIVFLDQDDGIETELLERYVEAIESTQADMAVFGKTHYYVVNDIIKKIETQQFEEELVTDKIKIYNYLFNVDNKKRLMTIWNCIYRKELIDYNKLTFDTHFKHGDEDGMFNFKYVMNCESIYFSSRYYYHYYIRKGLSTSTKYNNELKENFLYFIDTIRVNTVELCKDDYIEKLIELYLLRFFSNKYKRFAEFHRDRENKINFLKDISENETMKLAFQFSNSKYSKMFGKKYYYWDLVNSFFRSGHYHFAMIMLDFLIMLK